MSVIFSKPKQAWPSFKVFWLNFDSWFIFYRVPSGPALVPATATNKWPWLYAGKKQIF
jgi:hypothetical protein